MKNEKRIRISFPARNGEIIVNSLRPELKDVMSRVNQTNLHIDNGNVILEIAAEDTNALLASMNSYLRWIILISSICELKDERS